MALSALLKFTQGTKVGADGTALVVSEGAAVTITSADNTDVASWRIELLYEPPGSSYGAVAGSPVTLAQASSSTPTATLNPAMGAWGCYRIRLTLWDTAGYSGVSQQDIRNVGVATPTGALLPPPQLNPLPLKAPVPDELNFEGQGYGWAGGPLLEGHLVNETLKRASLLTEVPRGTASTKTLAAVPADTGDFAREVFTQTGKEFVIPTGTRATPEGTYSTGALLRGVSGEAWDQQSLGDDYLYNSLLAEPVSGKTVVVRQRSYTSGTGDLYLAEVQGWSPLQLGTDYPLLDTENGNTPLVAYGASTVGGGYLWVSDYTRVRRIDPATLNTSTGVFGTYSVPGPCLAVAYDDNSHGLYTDGYARFWAMAPGAGYTRFSTQDLTNFEFIAQGPAGFHPNYAGLAVTPTGQVWLVGVSNANSTPYLIRAGVEPIWSGAASIQLTSSTSAYVYDVAWDPDTQRAFVYWEEYRNDPVGENTYQGYISVFRWTGSAIALVTQMPLPASWGRCGNQSSSLWPKLKVFNGRVWGVVNGDATEQYAGGAQINRDFPLIRYYHYFAVNTLDYTLEELGPTTSYQWFLPDDRLWTTNYAASGTNTLEVAAKAYWAIPSNGLPDGTPTATLALQASPRHGDEVVVRDVGSALSTARTVVISATNAVIGYGAEQSATLTLNQPGAWVHLRCARINGSAYWLLVGRSSATASTDQYVKNSASDTTAGYLSTKLSAGKGLYAATTNPGGNEARYLASYAAAMPAWTYSSTTADADPGAGIFRLNNATPSSATMLYLSKTTASPGTVLDNLLRGLLVGDRLVFQDLQTSTYLVYSISGAITNATNYVKVPLTYEAGSGSLTNGFTLSVDLVASHPGVKNSSADTTSGYLSTKLQTGSGLTRVTGNPAANETLTVLSHAASVPAWTYDSSTADGNPANGAFRLNNATPSSVSMLYISKLTADSGMDWTTTLLALQPGDRLQLKDSTSGTAYRVYKVYAAVTDATGYVKIPVTHEASTGSFTSNDIVSIGTQYQHASYNVMDDPGAGPRATADSNLLHGTSKYGPAWDSLPVTGLDTGSNFGCWDGTHLVLLWGTTDTTVAWYDASSGSVTDSYTISGQSPLGLVGFEGANSSFTIANQKVFVLTQGSPDPTLTEVTRTGGVGRSLTLTGFGSTANGNMAQIGVSSVWCCTSSGLIRVDVPRSGSLTAATYGAGTNFADVLAWRGKLFALANSAGVIYRYADTGTVETQYKSGTSVVTAMGCDGAYLYLLQAPVTGGAGALTKVTFDLERLATSTTGTTPANMLAADFDSRLVFDGACLHHTCRLSVPASYAVITYDPRTLSMVYALLESSAGGALTQAPKGRAIYAPAANGGDLLVFPFVHFSNYLFYLRRHGKVELPGDVADKLVRVSATDSTSNYLGSKLVAGTNITLSTLNPAGNEQIQLNVAAAAAATPGVLQLTNDLGGSFSSPTVPRINGATVPSAGTLTTNHVLMVSGVSALSYGYLTDSNLATNAAITPGKLSPGAANTVLTANGTAASWSTHPSLDRVDLTEVDYGASVPAAGGWLASIDGGAEWLSKRGLRTKLAPVGTFSAGSTSTFAATRGSFVHYQETSSASAWTKGFDLSEVTSKLPSSYGGTRWIQTIRYVVQVSVPNTTGTVPAISYTGTLLVRRDGVRDTVMVLGGTDNVGDATAGTIAWSVAGAGATLTLTGTPGSAVLTTWGVWLDCTATYGSSTA